MFRTRSVAIAAALALTLGLAACGDDGGSESASADEQPYVDAMAASLKVEDDNPFEDGEVDCMANLFVTTVGVERFEQAGIEPADLETEDFDLDGELELTSDDEQAFVENIGDCFDVVDLFVQGIAETSNLDDEALDCIRDNADEDLVTRALAASLAGEDDDLEMDSEMETMFTDLADACPALMGG